MKIKFLKEYVAVDPATNSGIVYRFGETEEIENDTAEWLIDNGFAEEVKESGWWKPKSNESYYFLGTIGEVGAIPWYNDKLDKYRYSSGNVFKTKAAAERYRDYLKAVTTVRQDKGVLTSKEVESTERSSGNVWCIAYTFDSGLLAHTCPLDEMLPQTGAIYFNSLGHANDSLSNHPDEWKIIANYDWSRE